VGRQVLNNPHHPWLPISLYWQLQLAPTLKVSMTEAVINQNQQAKAFSPFGKRNANKDKIEQEEAELKQIAEDKNKDHRNHRNHRNLRTVL